MLTDPALDGLSPRFQLSALSWAEPIFGPEASQPRLLAGPLLQVGVHFQFPGLVTPAGTSDTERIEAGGE